MKRNHAYVLRDMMNKAATSLDDKDASVCAELFMQLKYDGNIIPALTRINWHGSVKRATVDLWDREENDPAHAPTLWENIDYRDGIRIIPNVITVTSQFSKDELGWWGDVVYRSKVDGNVYTPDEYPANWEVYSE